jgi:catechol 2,3-dioxygenase-like lactoylglutathione lyase family enzyme
MIKAPSNSNPRLSRILETSLYADELDLAEMFYRTVLGLDLFAKEAGRHLFFKCAQQMLLIFNAAATLAETEVAPHGACGPGHVAFAVPLNELDEWRSHLKKNGIPIEKAVRWPNGGRSIYFRDPARNCLEFASPLIWGMADTGLEPKNL